MSRKFFVLPAAAIAVVTLAMLITGRASGATVTVNSTLDGADASAGDGVCQTANAGECTLRAAIQETNALSGADTITFAIGSGLQTINVGAAPTSLGALPVLSGVVTINGATQPGYAGVPLIELDGTSAGTDVDGLNITAGNSTVQGLIINDFLGGSFGTAAIELAVNGGNTIKGNFIGTNAAGTLGDSNRTGIYINDTTNNTIGGTAGTTPGGSCTGDCNLIGQSSSAGIQIGNLLDGFNAQNNVVRGNFIGTDVTGTVDLNSGTDGITIVAGRSNTIGGTNAAARNVISGVADAGIEVTSNGPIYESARFNVIQGNYIGTDTTGTLDLGNTRGIALTHGEVKNTTIGGSTGTTPGGACTGACNLISGNNGNGITVTNHTQFGPDPDNNIIEGNYIGVNAAGTAAIGNSTAGISISSSSRNVIGGTTAAARNVISGNTGNGVTSGVGGGATFGNTVQGNHIGTNAAGTSGLANGGVGVAGSNYTIVGGTSASAGNVIAFNTSHGVTAAFNNIVRFNSIYSNGGDGIFMSSSTGAAFRENSIHSNGGLGIDLSPDGVTPNDAGDADTGANNLQNFPVVTGATSAGGSTAIQGTLNSTPNTSGFVVEFFSVPVCNAIAPNDFGEGQTFIGSATLTTDGSGNAGFDSNFGIASTPGHFVTATARNTAGNTSEFSKCIVIGSDPSPTPSPTVSPSPTPSPTASPSPTPSPTPTADGDASLVPNGDKANAGAWLNNSGTSCGANSIATICSSRINEPRTSPDDSDYIVSATNPADAEAEFQLTDSPSDLQTATSVTLRVRASKVGGKDATIAPRVFLGNSAIISPVWPALTETPTLFGVVVHNQSLTQADVNELYVRITGNTSGPGSDTTIRVQLVNVELAYVVGPPGGEDAAADIAAGSAHTCVVTGAGGLKCWGDNSSGQLGDGTTKRRYLPVDVPGLTSGVASVAAGGSHTCAVTTAGGLKCWGWNANGQLGIGNTTNQHSPVNVFTSGVEAVTAGWYHTCAVMTGGGVKCWGRNGNGQLGNGNTTDQHSPVDVSGLTSGVAAVSAGEYHTCALTTGGGVKCWGVGARLGYGSTAQSEVPVDVSGLGSGVTVISAGITHTCAVTVAGGVKCWGDNGQGQLGNGNTTSQLSPVDVSGLSSGVSSVEGGLLYTCALTESSGNLKCWGDNFYGTLADGTTIDRHTPVDSVGSTAFAQLAMGDNHGCARTAAGAIDCWGDNAFGAVGIASLVMTTYSTPQSVDLTPDDDGDGIPNMYDGIWDAITSTFTDESGVFSGDFTNQHLGGQASGSIDNPDILVASVGGIEDPNILEVAVSQVGSPGLEAQVNFCGGFPTFFNAGESISAYCGSFHLTVGAGPIGISVAGIRADMPSGVTASIIETSPSAFAVNNSSTSEASITVEDKTIPPGASLTVCGGANDCDRDGVADGGDNCRTSANAVQTNTDSALAGGGASISADTFGDACDADDDNDGWLDITETAIGTNPLDNCTIGAGSGGDAWPPDVDANGFSDISDISALTGNFAAAAPPAPVRHDIGQEPPDGFIDITDISKLTGLFGAACT